MSTPESLAPVSPSEAPVPASTLAAERLVILLVGAIQFVNVLDFVMVMPLGPDFAAALGIETSHIGIVGGSYTGAAAVAGVAGSLFLDRFDRRWALALAMLGLVLGTALGGLATGLGSLLLARILAGAFGGPATSLSLAVIADAVPPARRGKAMGAVMGAFAIASVLGVPAGLELAARLGWRAPFFAVATLGLLLVPAAIWLMPPMKGHLRAARPSGAPRVKLLDSVTAVSLTSSALVSLGMFAVIPNISAFVQHNLGYPRERIGLLYLVGGAVSFVMMRVVGTLVDRFGVTLLFSIGTALHAFALVVGFIHPWSSLVMLVFIVFMLSSNFRMVPLQALTSRVPRPEQRARFMSAQSAVQHAASALGAIAASAVLFAAPDGKLVHMEHVAGAAILIAAIVPFTVAVLERRVRSREAAPARA